MTYRRRDIRRQRSNNLRILLGLLGLGCLVSLAAFIAP